MEENLHEDKLDDYVRKSFEGYEDDPSEDLWNRVEAGLNPTADAAALQPFYRRYGWQLMAATVILLLFSTLVCEHLYYEDKLRNLTRTPSTEQSTDFNQETGTSQQALAQPSTPGSKPQPALAEEKVQPADQPLKTSAPKGKSSIQLTENQTENAIVVKKEAEIDHATPVQHTVPEVKGFSQASADILTATQTAGIQAPEANATVQAAEPVPMLLASLAPEIGLFEMPVRTILKFPIQEPLMIAEAPIKPSKSELSGWYIGLQTSILTGMEKSGTVVARPGRHVFLSKQKEKERSTVNWFKAGKRINGTFGLETGIGYQRLNRTATHTPRFRFGDGRPGQLGAPRSFEYDLNTYGGTAEVSLRMEATPGQPPADDEQLPLVITTEEKTELLRIPLLATVHFGKKRLNCVVKAGLLGNIVLKNELDISARVSENARFKPVAGNDGYTVALKTGKFFAGYSLSAGMEYKFNQHWSLVAESSLLGDLPRKDNYRQRKPQRYLMGLNVGANYYF